MCDAAAAVNRQAIGGSVRRGRSSEVRTQSLICTSDAVEARSCSLIPRHDTTAQLNSAQLGAVRHQRNNDRSERASAKRGMHVAARVAHCHCESRRRPIRRQRCDRAAARPQSTTHSTATPTSPTTSKHTHSHAKKNAPCLFATINLSKTSHMSDLIFLHLRGFVHNKRLVGDRSICRQKSALHLTLLQHARNDTSTRATRPRDVTSLVTIAAHRTSTACLKQARLSNTRYQTMAKRSPSERPTFANK